MCVGIVGNSVFVVVVAVRMSTHQMRGKPSYAEVVLWNWVPTGPIQVMVGLPRIYLEASSFRLHTV